MPSAVTTILSPAASGATSPAQTAAQARDSVASQRPASEVIKANQRTANRESAKTSKVTPDKKKVSGSPNLDAKRRAPQKQASEEEKDQGDESQESPLGHLDVRV